MSDTKTQVKPVKQEKIYGPSPVFELLELQHDLQELLSDREDYRF